MWDVARPLDFPGPGADHGPVRRCLLLSQPFAARRAVPDEPRGLLTVLSIFTPPFDGEDRVFVEE